MAKTGGIAGAPAGFPFTMTQGNWSPEHSQTTYGLFGGDCAPLQRIPAQGNTNSPRTFQTHEAVLCMWTDPGTQAVTYAVYDPSYGVATGAVANMTLVQVAHEALASDGVSKSSWVLKHDPNVAELFYTFDWGLFY